MKPQIVFIGTSASMPTHLRSSPAVLVCSFRTCILLDVGEAAQVNLGRVGIDLLKIGIIGVTHMHGDHYYGLVPLIDTVRMRVSSQDARNQHTIRILGPKDLCLLFNKSSVYEGGEEYCYNTAGGCLVKTECIDAKALSSGRDSVRTFNGEITVAPVAVSHGDIESYGYIARVKVCEKAENYITVFYSGDGICDGECIDVLRGFSPCVVIHEATFIDYESDRSKARQTFHATVGDAALLAQSVAAKILVITHVSPRYRADWIKDYFSRARRVFSGDVAIAEDLSVLPLDLISC
ncbi:MAG: MBL fold metallo-hydrolase [Ignisphaera sp.]|nr:MBL fold metallo-hydrolase [Ignisphaera sp.]MCX8167952.1 MBL fold metallo-hydrolase [Ignisphaera sp.]MDW8085549.1 MBL fold metallo-hydrolase [Ignisphaera sp.]